MRVPGFPISTGAPKDLLAELFRRLESLERAQLNGPGVSTSFGAIEARATQSGFPVELTSAWDETTGYSWKRLGLNVVGGVTVGTPDAQPVGDGAATPNNETSLTPGTRGWLETDPQSRGYLFLQVGPNGGSLNPTCGGPSWLSALRPSDCVRVSLTYTPAAAVSLSVEDCAECPGGASASYTTTLSGFTADFADANGTWVLARDSGECTWSATNGTFDLLLWYDGGGGLRLDLYPTGGEPASTGSYISWSPSAPPADCAGPFAFDVNEAAGSGYPTAGPTVTAVPVSTPVTQTLTLRYHSESGTWRTTPPDTLTICGVEYTVELDPDSGELTLVGPLPEGGAEPVRFAHPPRCGGCAYALYDFGRGRLCPCDEREGDICDDVLTVRIEHTDCAPIEVSCLGNVFLMPPSIRLRFGGDLAALGSFVLPSAPADEFQAVWLAPDLSVAFPGCPTAVVTRIRVAYSLCSLSVQLYVTTSEYPDGNVLSCTQLVTDTTGTPLPYTFDFEDVCAFFLDPDSGCTYASGSLTVEDAEDTYVAPGYGGPGWYLTSDGKKNLTDDSPELCDPTFRIICGPYASEAALDAAIADGSCFPEDCAPIAGWDGAGWYCVEDGAGGCVAQELTAADRCDTTITICSGPHADEAAAIAACAEDEPPHARWNCLPDGTCQASEAGGVYETRADCEAACGGSGSGSGGSAGCCPPGNAESVGFTVEGPVGAACAAGTAAGTATVTGGFDGQVWQGPFSASGGPTGIGQLRCVGGAWSFLLALDGTAGGGGGLASGSLSNVGGALVGTATVSGGPCAGQSVTITFAAPCVLV